MRVARSSTYSGEAMIVTMAVSSKEETWRGERRERRRREMGRRE